MTNDGSVNRALKAIYPGSFDPITLGHVDIIRRMAPLYKDLTILISHAEEKKGLFTPEERMELIKSVLSDLPHIQVDIHRGLTVDYAQLHKAQLLIRGLRAVVDFEYEISMANINRKMAPEIETLLVFASPQYYFISSRAVKEVAQLTRDPRSLLGLVPPEVIEPLIKKIQLHRQ